ncbi:MAG: DUF6261 family protein [Prevotellaceae bacterium]|jgi:hypothetical protein|nr:DUF6261 family protein [Prevotellaceae bacterium]
MTKFIKVTLKKFRRGTYFNFITQIYALFMGDPLVAKKAAQLLALFAVAIAHVDEALAIARKSEFTDEIAALNAQRHSLFAGLKAAVKALLRVASTQQDAKALLQLFKDYGIKRSLHIDEATGLFSNLIADLEGPFSKAVQAMNLRLLVSDLKEANSKLQQLSENRLSEANANGTARLADAREEADGIYHQLTELVEALVVTEGEAQYAEFIDRANTVIKHYKQQALGQKVTEKIPGTGDNNNGGGDGNDGEEEPPQG